MKRYFLLRLQYNANRVITECDVATWAWALKTLQADCPVKLDEMGYAKNGDITYCVAEGL
jgi:hypothetical protein